MDPSVESFGDQLQIGENDEVPRAKIPWLQVRHELLHLTNLLHCAFCIRFAKSLLSVFQSKMLGSSTMPSEKYRTGTNISCSVSPLCRTFQGSKSSSARTIRVFQFQLVGRSCCEHDDGHGLHFQERTLSGTYLFRSSENLVRTFEVLCTACVRPFRTGA